MSERIRNPAMLSQKGADILVTHLIELTELVERVADNSAVLAGVSGVQAASNIFMEQCKELEGLDKKLIQLREDIRNG